MRATFRHLGLLIVLAAFLVASCPVGIAAAPSAKPRVKAGPKMRKCPEATVVVHNITGQTVEVMVAMQPRASKGWTNLEKGCAKTFTIRLGEYLCCRFPGHHIAFSRQIRSATAVRMSWDIETTNVKGHEGKPVKAPYFHVKS